MKFPCERCGNTVSVPDGWLDTTVKCPHCGKKLTVRAHPPEPEAPPPAAAVDPDEPDEDLGEFSLAPAEERPRSDVLLEHVSASDTPTGASSSTPPSPPAAKPGTGRGPRRATGTKPQKTAHDCPNCGAQLPPDGMLCVTCGYHITLGRVLETDLDDVGIDKSIGFQRWFKSQLAEGESAASLIWAMHALVAAVSVIVGLMFHPWSWAVVLPGVTLYLLLMIAGQKTQLFANLGERLWKWMLRLHRLFGWRHLAPPFARRRVLRINNPRFGDEELAAIPELDAIEVLDLEGTLISDRALLHLQNCDNLQCIVVRGTRFTRQGLMRLQIMKPQVAIWY